MVDEFTVLVRVVRMLRGRMSSSEIVEDLFAAGVCSREYAYLITSAVVVDEYMTTLDVVLTFPDLPLEDLALECHPDE